jgi:hypothetical protein
MALAVDLIVSVVKPPIYQVKVKSATEHLVSLVGKGRHFTPAVVANMLVPSSAR